MHFIDVIKELAENMNLTVFVDMDGVIASYDVGKPLNFKNKRPLKDNIDIFKKLSLINNVELHILSICRQNYQINEKNDWLDQYASFFNKNNRHIISKEGKNESSSELKINFLKSYQTDNQMVLVDDDNKILNNVLNELDHVILFQDSELVD